MSKVSADKSHTPKTKPKGTGCLSMSFLAGLWLPLVVICLQMSILWLTSSHTRYLRNIVDESQAILAKLEQQLAHPHIQREVIVDKPPLFPALSAISKLKNGRGISIREQAIIEQLLPEDLKKSFMQYQDYLSQISLTDQQLIAKIGQLKQLEEKKFSVKTIDIFSVTEEDDENKKNQIKSIIGIIEQVIKARNYELVLSVLGEHLTAEVEQELRLRIAAHDILQNIYWGILEDV
jgi:hypothetical protein